MLGNFIMILKYIRSASLIGILSFCVSYDALAVFPQESDWGEIIKKKVPTGRHQLQTYKNIYTAHVHTHGNSKEIFANNVEDLEKPLGCLYASAHQRLKKLEVTNPQIAGILGESPTIALKKLYLEHIQDPLRPLSVSTFKGCVLDVVGLMDLAFHPNDQYLWNRSLDEVFSEKNIASEDSFFSPVFLQKQGISIPSINFGFFGQGPFLAVVEVGPNRNAHQGLYSQTNRRFIMNHDNLHNSDTQRFLVQKLPQLFSAFQVFHDKIEILQGDVLENQGLSAKTDLLHMGLFLLGHEYVNNVFQFYTVENDQSILEEAVKNGIAKIKSIFRQNFHTDENNYVVLYKDSFDGIAQVMEKYMSAEKDKTFYKNIRWYFNSNKRAKLGDKFLNRFLNAFEEEFMKLASPLIMAVDQEINQQAEIEGA